MAHRHSRGRREASITLAPRHPPPRHSELRAGRAAIPTAQVNSWRVLGKLLHADGDYNVTVITQDGRTHSITVRMNKRPILSCLAPVFTCERVTSGTAVYIYQCASGSLLLVLTGPRAPHRDASLPQEGVENVGISLRSRNSSKSKHSVSGKALEEIKSNTHFSRRPGQSSGCASTAAFEALAWVAAAALSQQ